MAMSRLQELTDKTLPWVAASGRLGKGAVKFVKCIVDDGSSGEAQFASTVCFMVAVFEGDGRSVEQPMVVKFNMDDELARNWLHLNEQFRNEVFVYERVLPFLDLDDRIHSIFPRYFYGSASESEDPSKYTVVLEDLRDSGYKLSPELLDLDFAHCALAFKQLGAFHALSFAAKQSNPKTFADIVEGLIESRLFEHNWEDADYLYAGSVARAAGPLLKNGEKVAEINNFKNGLKNSYVYFKNLLTVKEPMGVICHGDFCRNNVLYKYENESPIDIKFFDLATARYGSPMLDFTFFFFLNCSEKSRKLYRDEFLKIYHQSLSTTIPDVKLPSLEDFKEEFRRKAVYGFLICSFFKPALMDPVPFDPVKEVRNSLEVRRRRVLANGGEKGTEQIANMLRELIEMKYEL